MKLKLTMATMLLLFTGITAQAQKANFSGNWKLNLEKSQFGNVAAKAGVKNYNIIQKDSDLSLTWISENAEGKDVTPTQVLKLNGTPAPFLLPSGKTRTMTASFAEDGKSLILIRKYSKANKPEEADYEIKENWKLSADGKELHILHISPTYSFTSVSNRLYINSKLMLHHP